MNEQQGTQDTSLEAILWEVLIRGISVGAEGYEKKIPAFKLFSEAEQYIASQAARVEGVSL